MAMLRYSIAGVLILLLCIPRFGVIVSGCSVQPTNKVVVVGDKVSLTCQADEEGIISWRLGSDDSTGSDIYQSAIYRSDGTLRAPEFIANGYTYIRLNDSLLILEMIATNFSHGGVYHCHCVNPSSIASANVAVLAPDPEFVQDGDAVEGKTVRFICSILFNGTADASFDITIKNSSGSILKLQSNLPLSTNQKKHQMTYSVIADPNVDQTFICSVKLIDTTSTGNILYSREKSATVQWTNGILTIEPEDREVMVGESTYFNCSTPVYDKNVDWYFYPVGATGLDRKYVYAFGKLYKPYDRKVRIDNSSIGVWNLVILSATLEDAGRYVCQEDGEIGEQKSAQLVVLDTFPTCYGANTVIGPNSCGVEPDDLALSCSVTYSGNIPPVMQWKSSRNNESLSQYVTVKNADNIITYDLSVKANLQMSGSFFFCETTRSTSSQYNCNSDVINVLYVFSENSTVNGIVGDELVCSANKSKDLVCDYKWKWFEDEDSLTKSRISILKPTEPGWYRCEASCDIKKRPCNIHVVRAYVFSPNSEQTDRPKDLNSSLPFEIVVSTVVGLLIIVLLAVLVLFIYVKRPTKNDHSSTVLQVPLSKRPKQPHSTGLDTTYLGLLRGKQISILEVNRNVIADLIDPSKLLHRLYRTKFIEQTQMQGIDSRPTDFEKVQILVEMLLQILNEGRHEDYEKAMKCLRDTGHSKVADVLSEGDVVIRVHCLMCDYESSEKTSEIENMMVTSLTKYIQFEMSELEVLQINRILERTRINIIAARRGGSVVLYVSVAMMEELNNLEAELESGNLTNVIELLFETLSTVKITVTIHLQEEDLYDAKVFFRKLNDLDIRDEKWPVPTETAPLISKTNVDEEEPKGLSANDQIRSRVLKIFNAFVSNVDPDQLCDYLIANQIITTERWNMIRTKGTQQQRCLELLHQLYSITNPSAFLVVQDALKTICPYVYQLLEYQTDSETEHNPIPEREFDNGAETNCLTPQLEMASEDKWEEVIRMNFNYLVQKVDTGDDFLGALKKSHDSSSKRITLMLQCLERKDYDSFKKFCAALEISSQCHIVREYLSAVKKPSVKPDCETDDPDAYRPIAFDKAQCLKNNYTKLLEMIHFNDELLDHLGARNAFTGIQLSYLKEINDTTRRGQIILDKLANGSEKQFNDFCEALIATKQQHIVVELLTPHAVVFKKSQSELQGELTLATKVFTVDDIKKLYKKATTYVEENYSDDDDSACCQWFYRNQSPEYFNWIFNQKNGIMETSLKDNTGDPRSPINGQMKGLFFIASVCTYGYNAGKPLPKSPFGSRRVLVPAEDLLKKAPNLYFADFYCMRLRDPSKTRYHYVTIVMTVPGSETDQFCANHLMKLDINKNPFLFRDSSRILQVTTADGLFVEIFYTEDVDIKPYRPLEDTETIGQGHATPGGIPKDRYCPACNIKP